MACGPADIRHPIGTPHLKPGGKEHTSRRVSQSRGYRGGDMWTDEQRDRRKDRNTHTQTHRPIINRQIDKAKNNPAGNKELKPT